MQRRTEITIETERFLIVSRRRDRTVLWCNPCNKNVPMLTVDEAVTTANVGEVGRFHFAITPEGQLFICSLSLERAPQGDL
jgi:hypothetical protein